MNPAGQGIDLSGLRDIHLPPLPSVWPLAWGWYALAAAVLLCAFFLWLALKKKRLTAKKYALREIDGLCAGYAADPYRLASEISLLLKRIALMRFPRERTAGLYGKQWRAFLNETSKKPVFDGKAGEIAETVMYVPAERFGGKDVTPFVLAAKEWIREHA